MSSSGNPSHGESGRGLLRLIALFKLVKALSLIVVGISALRLVHGDPDATLTHWITMTGINPDGHFVDEALGRIANLPPSRFKELGIGSFVYATLFLVEGCGLWLRKRWAEWFTVIITGSLLPLEVYELHRHATWGKFVVLLINAGVVVYLLLRLRRERATGQDSQRPV